MTCGFTQQIYERNVYFQDKNDNIFRIDTQLEVLKMDTIVNQAWHLSLFQFSLIAKFFHLNFSKFSKFF